LDFIAVNQLLFKYLYRRYEDGIRSVSRRVPENKGMTKRLKTGH